MKKTLIIACVLAAGISSASSKNDVGAEESSTINAELDKAAKEPMPKKIEGDSFKFNPNGSSSSSSSPSSPSMADDLFNGPTSKRFFAITIDDGPSSYTPAMLEVLKRHKAQATFFMLGGQVKAYPDLARKVRDAGHQIGNHTYHHKDFCVRDTPAREADLEFEIQSSADEIKKAVGFKPTLLRMPYGCNGSWVLRTIKKTGVAYNVLWSVDPNDWKMPGVASIENSFLKGAGPGAIILMHDGGGNRSQTVKALDAFLTVIDKRNAQLPPDKQLKSETIDQMLGLKKSEAKVAAVETLELN